MAELDIDDLPEATLARFVDEDAAQLALDAALVAARRYAGWHVSPVRLADELLLDGPGSRILWLPTRKLLDVTDVEENTVVLDVTKLVWSQGGQVRKKSDGYWTCAYQSILVTIDHGYTEAEAADWRQAILAMVNDIGTSSISAEEVGRLIRKRVRDVEYQWDVGEAAERAVLSVSYILDSYQLLPVMYV